MKPAFSFHRARIFFDRELGFPVRYEAYGWPTSPGQEPPLNEEFTFTDVRLDVGLADRDFNITNPAYSFPR